jgi:hypothetical protein
LQSPVEPAGAAAGAAVWANPLAENANPAVKAIIASEIFIVFLQKLLEGQSK